MPIKPSDAKFGYRDGERGKGRGKKASGKERETRGRRGENLKQSRRLMAKAGPENLDRRKYYVNNM